MTPLAEYMIVAGDENRSPMIDKSMYNSWESRMLLYIKGNKNGRMMLESIENGPLVYPNVEENGQIRKKKYAELTEQEQLQDDCDVQATNIVLQCTELSYQERECKLYNEFDKFTSVNGESLHEYYLRFSQLINDMHTIGMTMQQVQECSSIISTRTSFNPKNQATIQDGKFTIQQVQGRHGQSYDGTGTKGNATSLGGNNAAGLARVVKCYNCQESGQVFDEEHLAFLADPGVVDGQDIQAIITHKAAFQTDDLDAYESNCDDISSAKAVLMANLLSYGSNVL
ncbi:hypothetical protein Tco_0199567 [Tanacetum coccineum]